MRFFTGLVIALAAVCAWGTAWLLTPMDLPGAGVELTIEPGASAREAAQSVQAAGVQVAPTLLYAWFRLSGQSRQIRAGSYALKAGATPWSLLDTLVRGEQVQHTVTLLEGWTFRQVRQLLAQTVGLKPDTQALSDAALMAALGRAGQHPEGRFFPDTYRFAKGSSDLGVLRRAMEAMDTQLQAAWSQRAAQIALRTPDEALILASIVEKETGKAEDQPMIAAVFHNRLHIGMRLQTDPTVIYGLGERFDGNLRRTDLQTDTPYNSYTRDGLPPTPIALPGKAALRAAVQPAASKALYFVARGDGSSQFSTTLDAHNRAVDTYQRGH